MAKEKYQNFYQCPACGHSWQDYWDSGCDDECPACGQRDVSPYRSVAVNEKGERINPGCAEIPLNYQGLPKISNAMKAQCMGEFTFSIEESEIDQKGEVTGNIVDREVTVPWDLCKRIYQKMAQQAIQDAKGET